MPGAKGEAGELGAGGPRGVSIGGAEAKGEAGSVSTAVGAATGVGNAFGSGASIAAAVGATTSTSISMQVGRAPFSEAGMAERFVADPAFYKNLAAFVASEIRRQAEAVDGSGNIGASTKSQLTELADGFSEIATGLNPRNGVLTPQAAAVVARLVTGLRATYTAIMENHPEIINLASIGLAAYAFHRFGFADPDLSLLVSTAVVKKEKLADIISAWFGEKK